MAPHPSPSSTSHSVVSRKPKHAEMIQGLEVEIAKSEQGFEGSWYIAKIIKSSTHAKNKFLVEYKDLLDDKGSKQLKEYIHFRKIRPLQLMGVGVSVQTFQVNQEIDAFHDDGWWKGVITEVLDDFKYKVCFQPSEEEMEVQHSNLRLHMEWIDGNWVDSSQHQEVTVVRQNGVVEPPHTTDSLVRSTTMAAQITPSSSFDNFCENIMASSRNTSGGMGCESTAHQTDLLSGHVKRQKNMFQSAPKRDDQFFRSSKIAREGEETEFSINSSASHARGKPIRSPIDREAKSVLSLPTTKGKRSKRQNKKGTRTPISSKRVLPLPYGRLDKDNHSPSSICKRKAKDDFEQNTCRRKLPLESSPHLSDDVEVDHIVVALPSQQMKEKAGEESVSNQTPNVVKRKRGKPKGIEQKNASSESQVLVLSSESEGLENQSTKKKRNHVQTERTPAVSPTPKNHQTPTFLLITDACVAEDNGGNVDGAADNELATVQKNGTSGPTVEEDLQHSLCPEDPNTLDGGESAKTDLTAVQKDHAQLLSLITKEHHSPRMVEDNGDDQFVPNGVQRYQSVESLKNPQSSDEVDIWHIAVAAENERALQPAIDVRTTNVHPSLVEHDGVPQSPEKGSLPFIKRSPMWEYLESVEALRLIPQHPHFRPLENDNEELREGNALGQMCNFVHLMERTCMAHLDDPISMYKSKFEALNDLEKSGFTVHPIRSRLELMLKVKDSVTLLDDQSKSAKVELVNGKCESDKMQESVTQLKMQLEALLMKKEMHDLRVAELEQVAKGFDEQVRQGRLQFESILASPW